MTARQAGAYWALTGSLLGFGALDVVGVGLPVLLFGLVLLAYGVYKPLSAAYMWAALVAMGVVPAVLLLGDYWAIQGRSHENMTSPTAFLMGGSLFATIAVAGAILGIRAWRSGQREG